MKKRKNILVIENPATTVGTIHHLITADPTTTLIRLPDGTLLKIKRPTK